MDGGQMPTFLVRFWEILKMIGKRFFEDRLTYSASALTYTTLLALVPLITVSIVIVSAFPISKTISDQVQTFIFQNFIPASGQVIQQYLQGFVGQAAKMSLIGTVFLFVTAVLMMLTIESAFNYIWGVKYRRKGLSAFFRYWAVLTLAPIFISLSIAATSYVLSLPLLMGTVTSLGIKKIIFSSVPMLLTMIAFALLYIAVPNCSVPWRCGFIGAFIATILFELAKKVFVLYLTHFPSYRIIYGAMASVPIFLVWIYLLWVIILFGALISNVLSTAYFDHKVGEVDGFTQAFMWLGYLWKAQQEGQSLSISQLYRLLPGKYLVNTSDVLQYLQKSKLIKVTSHNRYMLSKDCSKVTLNDLYQTFPWKIPGIEKEKLFSKKIQMLFSKANQTLQKTLSVPLSELYSDLFKG